MSHGNSDPYAPAGRAVPGSPVYDASYAKDFHDGQVAAAMAGLPAGPAQTYNRLDPDDRPAAAASPDIARDRLGAPAHGGAVAAPQGTAALEAIAAAVQAQLDSGAARGYVGPTFNDTQGTPVRYDPAQPGGAA